MTLSPALLTLGRYLAGEFDNREQAIADPAWYVHLRLWQRPVPLFVEDSLTLFAEQANIVNLDQPYRPRIMRIQQRTEPPGSLQVQYYMLKDLAAVQGAGSKPEVLQSLTADQIELLPGCMLVIDQQSHMQGDRFVAALPQDAQCCFSYQGQTIQISLGFEISTNELLSYDKGIDPTTGKATWGAILGPFRFIKRQDFAAEFPV